MKKLFSKPHRHLTLLIILMFSLTVGVFSFKATAQYAPQTDSGAIGAEGKISSPPPTQAPSITSPSNGAVFSTLPITVTGYCPKGLLIKLFKNDVFSGSVMCTTGSYSIQTDLFSASNHLVARAYDALDQAGPDSNQVTVTFHDSVNTPTIEDRVLITTNYARKGANPNTELIWPMIISGGTPPYAVTVDWGDGSTNDVYSITTPGAFDIKHTLAQAGVYRVLIKASDKNGTLAFLQVVAIGNGEVSGNVAGASADKTINTGKTIILWQPAAIAIPLILSTFWLGKKYEVTRIKHKLSKGEHPFK